MLLGKRGCCVGDKTIRREEGYGKRKREGARKVEDNSKRKITRYREEEAKEEVEDVVKEVGKEVESG